MSDEKSPVYNGGYSNRDNYVTLRDYIESRLREIERTAETSVHNSDKALKIASAANEYRLQEMNSFRKAMSDQAGSFVPRAEFDNLRKSYQEDDETLRISMQAEIKSLQRTVYTLVGALTAIQAIITFLATRLFN